MINISEKLDTGTIELYSAVSEAIASAGAQYLVVSASARDLVLHFGYDIRVDRATKDTDFGIQVGSWQQFEEIKGVLINAGFRQDAWLHHRLISPNDLKIDIVPIGRLEDENSTISWPSSGETVMNVLGFKEVLASADMVRISELPKLDIPVAAPEGMALLKTIA